MSTTNPLVLSTCKHWPHVLRLHVSKTDNTKDGPVASGGLRVGLHSPRKRHVVKDPNVDKAIEKAFSTGDCEEDPRGAGQLLTFC